MIDSIQSIYDLPYRARIMMTASLDNQKSVSCSILNNIPISTHHNLHNLKAHSSKSTGKSNNNYPYPLSSGDLQPLQWLQQDTILSITPLDNEEEFVPGKDDITSVTTSPVKIDVISESKSEDSMSQNSTIADYYRYQAMRAAMANGHGQNGGYRQQGYLSYAGSSGVRPNTSGSQHNLCHSVNEYQKPPFSYTHIIFMAIETSANKAMTVNDIYVWCETHFPYYTQAGVGWKNSLRHNLSINKSFKKISRDGRGGPGRGAYWVVEPRERNNLIDAIRRSPCSLGSFPFLSGTYPLGTGNCYSNNIFQSANTLNNNLTSMTANRSIVNNKLNSSSDLQTSSSSRGPLLRIGGQLTDASNLIRSTPVIQRLNDSSSLIDLPKASQIISNTITLSTVPLIQFDHIKFESDVTNLNESTDSNDPSFPTQQLEEEDCRGKVFVLDDPIETNAELCQTYMEIIRGLSYNVNVKSNSSRSDSMKDCSQQQRKPKRHSHHKNASGKSSGLLDGNLPPEAVSESDESESSISNKEFSELSDTDFNWRINNALQNQRKDRKNMYFSKLKSLGNNRKLSHYRNRITNVIRAPHPDHVYTLFQEFLTPANTSENQSPNNQIVDDKESFASTIADDKSLSINLSQTSLSKRSKHKLQVQKKSLKQLQYSDSEGEYFSTSNYENLSKKLIRKTLAMSSGMRKQNKASLSTKIGKQNCRLLKENSAFTNKRRMYEKYTYDHDDDEERENRYYENNDSNDEIFISKNIYKSIKSEEYVDSFQDNNDNNKSNRMDYSLIPLKRIRLAKDPNVKRKVGRPKKSEYYSNNYRLANDHRIIKDKLSTKLKKKLKSSKRELKYLKECNTNKDMDNKISNKEEQVAINILANLQRKNQQERIKNMYNLSNYIERNNSDSNRS